MPHKMFGSILMVMGILKLAVIVKVFLFQKFGPKHPHIFIIKKCPKQYGNFKNMFLTLS